HRALSEHKALSVSWSHYLIENDHLRRYLGERFCHVYHACKNDELLQFERLITETEIEWMLKNA
ncbi:hypothetical protein, partial [Escherichia coli]|uniref:hypothetical protein n=2 Tax=Escherichia coli TaxID=562 RepID=UPI0031B5920C